MLDLLLLWDAIFAIDKHFELTKYIVVAMLVSIREESECFDQARIQRFPIPPAIHSVFVHSASQRLYHRSVLSDEVPQ